MHGRGGRRARNGSNLRSDVQYKFEAFVTSELPRAMSCRRKGCCRAAHKRAQDAAAGKNHVADMACDASLHLLQDEGLLPACHERVGIALRLDSVARSSAKKHADKKWMASAAADLGTLCEYQRYQSLRYVEEILKQIKTAKGNVRIRNRSRRLSSVAKKHADKKWMASAAADVGASSGNA